MIVVTRFGTPGGPPAGDPLDKQPGIQSGSPCISCEGSTAELLPPR
ncbi:unnamed protein product, partial [Toxocara canis]|uniref:Uncharacterized protein n=1 Tax=Toxocara canis TaxID=6265 RepID=A0A183VF57_TOXCA